MILAWASPFKFSRHLHCVLIMLILPLWSVILNFKICMSIGYLDHFHFIFLG